MNTGDQTTVEVYVLALGVSAFLGATIVVYRKKKRMKNEYRKNNKQKRITIISGISMVVLMVILIIVLVNTFSARQKTGQNSAEATVTERNPAEESGEKAESMEPSGIREKSKIEMPMIPLE